MAKPIGILLTIIGLGWLIYAFNMETTVQVPKVGLFELGYSRVHNLEMAEERRTQLMFGALALLIGVGMTGFSLRDRSSESKPIIMNNDEKKCPYCAEYIKSEAKLCRFCGKEQPELPERKYSKITSNEVFRLVVDRHGSIMCPGCGSVKKITPDELEIKRFGCPTCGSDINFKAV